jgi:hypothetical protein
MPEKNGKRDTQRTDQGHEIPVPKRKDVFDVFDKAAKKKTDQAKKKPPK